MNQSYTNWALLLAWVGGCFLPCSLAATPKPVASFKAEPFALQDVRLLDSPFKAAMERDGRYLLEFSPDRLLHTFRLNAGLPSSAEPLGGWEAPRSEIRGHFVGHYLSACALMYASTGDPRFKERAALLVAEFTKCQAALGPSGYLSAFPESFFDRVESTGQVWAPYYTLHKILAGLLDVHALCTNQQALEVASRLGDWVNSRNERLNDAQLQKMLGVEHGGINESMAELYAATGELKYLRMAQRLYHKRVLDPLAAHEDRLSGLHANTQFPKVIGLARLYELSGDDRDRDIAEFFWDRVVNHHSYVIGGNSDHEGFGAPDKLNDRISPWTAESCNTYNMLKLTRHLFAWDASPAQADYYERALYNHILASQDPRTGMMAYHIPVYGGWFMPYNTPLDSAWCCTGTGVENHAKYGDSIYWHDADGLFVNLFIPSELVWRERGITVRQETKYPEQDTTSLEIRCSAPCTMTLRVRYPAWAQRGMTVQVNDQPLDHKSRPGTYVGIHRTWKNGDRVKVQLPFSLRLEPMPDNPARAAICYGPVVLAGELGTDGIAPPMPYAKNQGDFFNAKPPRLPVLLAQGRAVADWVKPVPGKPLTFRTKGVGRPKDLTLVAFYTLPPQRYSLYWDILSPAQWKTRLTEEQTQARRQNLLAARTVDSVQIGHPASEKAHLLAGERTRTGAFSDRSWRDAADGGWFSYNLKLPPDRSASILCTYWGSDAGPRTFDILVDGVRITTQKLDNNRPGQFFEVEYAIPEQNLVGHSSIHIRFQGHPNQMAGGLFDLRILKAKDRR